MRQVITGLIVMAAFTLNGSAEESISRKDLRAFHRLIERESIDKVEDALKTTPGLLTAQLSGDSPIHAAAGAGRIDMLEFLIKKGADPTTLTDRGESILHVALKSSKFSEELLNYTLSKVDVKAVDKKKSLLAAAVNKNRAEVIERLVQKGASLKALNHMDMPPLLEAVEDKQVECVKALLKAGADIEGKHESKSYAPYWTAAFYATFNGDLEMLKLLVENNAKLDQRDHRGQSLISFAGNAEVATYLLKKGAVADDKKNPASALHNAASDGKVDVLAVLIKAGADVNNTRGHNRGTPLHAACGSSNGLEAVKLLIKHGSKVNAKDGVSTTPLMEAARSGNIETAKVLLKAKANAKAKGLFDTTALHYAMERGKVDMIPILLKAGLSVNAKESDGDTPLHTAAKYDQLLAVKALLKAGAKKSAKNKAGKRPADLAEGKVKELLAN